MANETEIVEIHISDLMLWIGLAVFLSVMAWWVLGDSPTTEILGLAFSIVGILVAWGANEDIKFIKQATVKILEKVEKL